MLALILHGKCWLLLIKAQGDYDLPIISNLAGYKARPWTLSSQHLYLCQAFLFHVIYMYDLRKVRDKPGSNNSKIQLFRIFISLLHCVQLLSHVLLFVTASHQAPLSFTTQGSPVLHYLPEFAQTHVFPLSQWCHLTISSSVAPLCSQSFPAAGSFLMSQFFTSGGQRIFRTNFI